MRLFERLGVSKIPNEEFEAYAAEKTKPDLDAMKNEIDIVKSKNHSLAMQTALILLIKKRYL
jgi:hypothetical protein